MLTSRLGGLGDPSAAGELARKVRHFSLFQATSPRNERGESGQKWVSSAREVSCVKPSSPTSRNTNGIAAQSAHLDFGSHLTQFSSDQRTVEGPNRMDSHRDAVDI
jgi:hypothetical protein